MTNLETYCIRVLLAIKNGLKLLWGVNDEKFVKRVNYDADGLNAVIEFEGKEYRIKIVPL